MKTYVYNDFNGAIYWVQSFPKDCEFKCTSLHFHDFNVYEGNQITFRIKAIAPKGKVFSDTCRKSKIHSFTTNSTWVEDFDWKTKKELQKELNDYFNSFI